MHFYEQVRTVFLDFKYFVILIWCYCILVFVGWGGGLGGGAPGTLSNYNVLIQMRSFVLVIKNNEAVLVIK